MNPGLGLMTGFKSYLESHTDFSDAVFLVAVEAYLLLQDRPGCRGTFSDPPSFGIMIKIKPH